MNSDAFYVVMTLLFGMLFGVMLISIAKASTRHVVSIGPTGADPAVCTIDRNDQVAFRNDTGERIWLYLPDVGTVRLPLFGFVIEPRETSKAVEWNMDNVNAEWEVAGEVVVTVKTTDDPVDGCVPSGRPSWRIVIGGIAGG